MVIPADPRHHYGMVRVFLFLAAVELTLVVLALISCLSAERRAVRSMPRAAWIVAIVVLPLLGPVAWFLAGRPRPGDGGPARPPRRPTSPDDDPDFLRSLNADDSRRDRELFENWERDLHGPADPPRPAPPKATPDDETPPPEHRNRPRDGESTQPDA